MNAKSPKTVGTKTTKSTAALAKTQAKATKRVGKIAAKHEAIRKAGQPVKPAPAVETVSMEQKVANAAGEAMATMPANPLLTARGSEFTDALNAATVEQLEEALKHPGMSNQYRNRIGIALKLRTTPADDVARTVAAVTKGDMTKGIEVPTAGKKMPATKAARPEGKMSGLDAAAKVLAESPTPLNAAQIVEQAAAKGYWVSPGGRTPASTIYAAMLTNARKGDQARFKKVDRGLWTLTDAGKAAAK